MQVTETLADGLKRAFTVVLPDSELEPRRAARFAELGRTIQLPGFRPGKVPMTVLRQRFGAAVVEEALEEAVNESTRTLLADRNLRPAIQPKVDFVSKTPPQDVEFTLELEVLPEIALPDFAAIELTRQKAEVPEAAIDEQIEALRQRNRKLTPLTEEELAGRGAAPGEVVTLDYEGSIDGTPFEGGKATDAEVEVGGPGYIEGFSQGIEGIRPGETRVIEAQFPEGYGVAALSGKTAKFTVTAKRIQRAEFPDPAALAEQLSFESVDELRGLFRRRLQGEYDGLARQKLKRALLDRLADLADFPLPPALAEAEFAQIWARVEADRKAGNADADDAGKDEETLRSEYRAIAERRVRLGLLLAEAGRVHNITVAPEEITRAMRAEAARYPGQSAQVMEFYRRNPQAAEYLRGPIFEDKVVDFVLELAKVTEETVPVETLTEVAPPPPAA
jgi:trigger factor